MMVMQMNRKACVKCVNELDNGSDYSFYYCAQCVNE